MLKNKKISNVCCRKKIHQNANNSFIFGQKHRWRKITLISVVTYQVFYCNNIRRSCNNNESLIPAPPITFQSRSAYILGISHNSIHMTAGKWNWHTQHTKHPPSFKWNASEMKGRAFFFFLFNCFYWEMMCQALCWALHRDWWVHLTLSLPSKIRLLSS